MPGTVPSRGGTVNEPFVDPEVGNVHSAKGTGFRAPDGFCSLAKRLLRSSDGANMLGCLRAFPCKDCGFGCTGGLALFELV